MRTRPSGRAAGRPQRTGRGLGQHLAAPRRGRRAADPVGRLQGHGAEPAARSHRRDSVGQGADRGQSASDFPHFPADEGFSSPRPMSRTDTCGVGRPVTALDEAPRSPCVKRLIAASVALNRRQHSVLSCSSDTETVTTASSRRPHSFGTHSDDVSHVPTRRTVRGMVDLIADTRNS